jgi:hypothetical protein
MRLILLITLLSSTALAEPKYVPSIIPMCEVRDIKPGEKGCVYNLEQVKQLYIVDAELSAARKEIPLLQQKETLQGSIISKMDEQLKLSLLNVKLFKDRNQVLTDKLIATDKELQYEKVKPRWGSYIVWGAVAVVASAFTGYIIADQVSK